MADTSFDVIIIGSGPGGYVTALRAAQLGFKTAIVEKSYLGGICLNWGCIATTALLRSAELYHDMQHVKDYGLSAEKVSFDPKAVVQRSRGVSKRLNDGVGFLMKKNKISIIWGAASIDAPGKVTVKKSDVEAPKGTLGEGANLAKHIIVANRARKRFEKQGIKIMSSTKVTKLEKKSDSVVATIDDGKGKPVTSEFERVISAVGVVGNIENLGLVKLGVKP